MVFALFGWLIKKIFVDFYQSYHYNLWYKEIRIMEFLKININPKNKKTTDCAVRAVAQACNTAYDKAAKELFDAWMETGYEMTEPRVIAKVLAHYGFIQMGKPKHANNKTYSVKELCDELGKGHIILAQVAGHYTVLKGDKLLDLWDCSEKSVYRYFIKPAKSPRELTPLGKVLEDKKKRRVL